jgi:hypothetical protein
MRFLLALFLSGCAIPIGHVPPPPDWPQLEFSVYKAGFSETQRLCPSGLGITMGCAYIDFDKKTCIAVVMHSDMEKIVIDHEKEHCLGKDHVNDTWLADYWARWKCERDDVTRCK